MKILIVFALLWGTVACSSKYDTGIEKSKGEQRKDNYVPAWSAN